MNVGHWYLRRGRIDRPTYWLQYFLPLTVFGFVVEFVIFAAYAPSAASAARSGGTASVSPVLVWPPAVIFLLIAVPSISSQVTRLHDRGHSAWWLLFNLLPIAGPIVLIVQMCLPGDPGPNAYGPPPRPRNRIPDPPYPTTYG